MKKIMLVLSAMVMLSGCGLANSRYLLYNPSCEITTTVTVGSIMVQIEDQCKNDVYGNILASFLQQLIYSGKIGNTLRITYREFYNNLARPAFSQELTYDLSENIITFRSTTIKVKEVTNSSITFIVLESSPICKKKYGDKIGGCSRVNPFPPTRLDKLGETKDIEPPKVEQKIEKTSIGGPVTSAPTTFSSGTTKILTWDFSDVKSDPGNDFSSIATVRKGDKLTIMEQSGEWVRVRLQNGQEGWVRSEVFE